MADLITAGDIQWPLIPPCGDTGPDGCPPAIWAEAQAIAIDWVWALSGRQFGQWDVVFRPEWTIPVRRSNQRYVLGDGYRPEYPTAPIIVDRPLRHAPLPGPVASITEVLVDNVVVDPTAYEVINDQLVRRDGGQWYRYQDLTQPLTAAGTWQISYLRGAPVPVGGQAAAGVLACEQAKALMGDTKCRLPNNTTAVTRNGASVSLDAKQPQKGFTTLREVDQWCRLVNPNGAQSPPQVWSPDLDPNLQPPIPTSV